MADVVKRLQQSELPSPTGPGTSSVSRQPFNVPAPAEVLRDPFVPPSAAKLAEPEPTFASSRSDMQAKQKAAAQKLLTFLIRTGRFGTLAHDTKSKKDRPVEIKEAQRVLGVVPDGIVGPKTRAAAAAVGVALPERPKN